MVCCACGSGRAPDRHSLSHGRCRALAGDHDFGGDGAGAVVASCHCLRSNQLQYYGQILGLRSGRVEVANDFEPAGLGPPSSHSSAAVGVRSMALQEAASADTAQSLPVVLLRDTAAGKRRFGVVAVAAVFVEDMASMKVVAYSHSSGYCSAAVDMAAQVLAGTADGEVVFLVDIGSVDWSLGVRAHLEVPYNTLVLPSLSWS